MNGVNIVSLSAATWAVVELLRKMPGLSNWTKKLSGPDLAIVVGIILAILAMLFKLVAVPTSVSSFVTFLIQLVAAITGAQVAHDKVAKRIGL